MQFLVDKIQRLRCAWNKKPLTDTDFYRLCRRKRITVQEMPLRVSGFYYCLKGRHFIAVDSRMSPQKKLFVMFHEFAHYLMHSPDTGVTANFHGIGKRTRKEAEADAFALCALIPKKWVEERKINELLEDEGFGEQLVRDRFRVFDRYGI